MTVPPPSTVPTLRLAETSLPLDPGQQAVGLRPSPAQPVEHPLYVGPPEQLSAAVPPPPRQFTQVAVVTPLMMVVKVSSGVAIFGAAGGRAITP